MKRRMVWLLLSGLVSLVLALGWLGFSEAGLGWLFQRIQHEIPGQLKYSQMQGTLFGTVELTHVDYLHQEAQLKSPHIRLSWSPLGLLTGHVTVDEFVIQNLSVELRGSDTDPSASDPIEIPVFALPFNLRVNQWLIEGINIHQGEQQYSLDRLEMSVASGSNQLDIKALELKSENLKLHLNGVIEMADQYPHQLQVAWSMPLSSKDQIDGQGSLVGDLSSTRLKQNIEHPTSIQINATVSDLLNDLNWQADVVVDQFKTQQWQYPLPELEGGFKFQANGGLSTLSAEGTAKLKRHDSGPVTARYQLDWLGDQSLQINALELRSETTGTIVETKGRWMPGPDGGQVDLQFDWQHLRWPIQQEAWFDSERGQGSLKGKLDRYEFTVNTTRPLPSLPVSDWRVTGLGDLKGVKFDQIEIDTLDGKLEASGALDWSEVLSWQAEVRGIQINPVSLAADWPGKLDFELNSEGSWQAQQVSAEMNIKHLQGQLRGYPIKLNSALIWRDQGVDIKQLDFSSGHSILSASGRIDERWHLDWALDSSDLAELIPQAEGHLKASGHLDGLRDKPQLMARIHGEKLVYLDYQAGRIEGSLNLDLLNPQQLDVDLHAASLLIGNSTVDRMEVTGNAAQMNISAISGPLQSDLQLAGVATEQGWQGVIQQANLKLGHSHGWQLEHPLAAKIEPQSVSVEHGCWSSDRQERLCADLHFKENRWESSLGLEAFQLNTLESWLPPDLKLDSTLKAKAKLYYQNQRLGGELLVSLPKGNIQYPLLDGEIGALNYQQGSIELELDDNGISSRAHLKLNDTEQINAKLNFPAANLLALDLPQQSVIGAINMKLNKLTPISSMIPEVEQLSGQIEVDVSVAGELGQPQLDGQMMLQQGSFKIPRLGLNVTDLEIKGQSQGFDRFSYTLTARSGDGQLNVEGNSQWSSPTEWVSDMKIRGNNIEIARIPEAQVSASPDLTLRVQPYHIEVSGKINIPYAHIEPRDFSNAVRASNDVIIVGEGQVQQKKWVIVSKVQVELGDRVHFFGYGFEGRLGGRVLIEEAQGQPTRANGEIKVLEGRYRAYGQRLEIQQGRLIFSGGPLAKPALDIRAARQLNDITVGIHALGSVDDARVELFSTPAMGQTDILSYLLLGRPLESASDEDGEMMAKAALALGLSGGDRLARSLREQFGLDEMRLESSDSGEQASLVIGRYLSPRLYVSYGIGLIEAFNTIIVRYQISSRWQLKAESGETHGADLIFSIER